MFRSSRIPQRLAPWSQNDGASCGNFRVRAGPSTEPFAGSCAPCPPQAGLHHSKPGCRWSLLGHCGSLHLKGTVMNCFARSPREVDSTFRLIVLAPQWSHVHASGIFPPVLMKGSCPGLKLRVATPEREWLASGNPIELPGSPVVRTVPFSLRRRCSLR